MKKPYPIRIEQERYNQLKKLNVDPSKLFREFVDKILGDKQCPICGSKLKESQSVKAKAIFFILFSVLTLSLDSKSETRQISLLGITAHGTSINKYGANSMRNKITSDGFLVVNPQLNLTYIKDDGSFKNFTALIDCYAQPALFSGFGKNYQVEKDLSLGYVLGVYIRIFPDRDTIDIFRIGNYQIIPTPALTLQYRIKDKLYLRVQSNYVINFIDLAWEF